MTVKIAEQVDAILYDSVFRPDEIKTNPETNKSEPIDPNLMIVADGVVRKFGFHKLRLENHRDEIKDLIRRIPSPFHKGTGDGWSFLNLCMDKSGTHWGEHIHAETLFALANGLGMARYTLPREMWSSLPGGMPYVVFDVNGVIP